MNSKQRRKQRRKLNNIICPNCNERGQHFINDLSFLPGFWTCAKCYGPDGKRLPEYCVENPFNDSRLYWPYITNLDILTIASIVKRFT